MNAPAAQLDERDERAISYLLCLILLSITAVLGLELRVLLESGLTALAFLLLALFVATTGIIAYALIHRGASRSWLRVRRKKIVVATAAVPAAIVDRIRQRAQELGLEIELDVYYLPRTWNVVDAYVSGVGRHQTIVMTGGMLKYGYSSDPDERAQFDFVMDHELGHIRQNDTTVLYIARATLLTTVLSVPVKVAIMAWLYEPLSRSYAELFPRSFSYSFLFAGQDATLGISWSPSSAVVAAAVIAFAAIGTLTLWGLYVMLVRRRELVADQFALARARDQERAVRALNSLLGTAGLSSAPPQSFQGNVRWHPKPAERMQAVGSAIAAKIGLGGGIVAALLVAVLLTFRFAFGVSTQARFTADEPSAVFEPLSGLFVLLVGTIVLTMFPRRASVWSSADQVTPSIVIGWSIAIAIALCVGIGLLQPVDVLQERTPMLRLERLDWFLLIGSMPLVVAVFCSARVIVDRAFPDAARSLETNLRDVIFISLIAIGTLWLLSLAFAPGLRQHRMSALESYVTKVEQRMAREKAAGRAPAPMELGAEFGLSLPDVPRMFGNQVKTGEDLVQEHTVELMGLDYTKKRLQRHEFGPPIAFLLLWQGPIRGTLF